jgi:hypothetical protein
MSNDYTKELNELAATVSSVDDGFACADDQSPIQIVDREIKMPNDCVYAVCCDANAQLLTFRLPQFVEGVDLSKRIASIKFQNANGDFDRATPLSVSPDAEGNLVVIWRLDERVTIKDGTVTFQLEFYETVDGRLYSWQTKTATFNVLPTLNVDGNITPPTPTWVQEIIAEVDKLKGMTVEAKQLAAGLQPTVELSETNGHYHFAFGIPKGANGKDAENSHLHENKETLDKITEEMLNGIIEDKALLYALQAQQAQAIMPENLINISYLFSDGRNEGLRTKLDTSYAVVMDYTYRRNPYALNPLIVRADSCESMQNAFNGASCTAIEFKTKDSTQGAVVTNNPRIKIYNSSYFEFASNWLANNKPNSNWDAEFEFNINEDAYKISLVGVGLGAYYGEEYYCTFYYDKCKSYKILYNGAEITHQQLYNNINAADLHSEVIKLSNCVFYKCGNGTPKLRYANHILYGCSNLTTVTGLDLSNATTFKYGAANCPLLTKLDVVSTGKVEDMSYAFYNSGVTVVVGLDTSNTTNLDGAFAKSKITMLTLNCAKVITAKGTFSDCNDLVSLVLENIANVEILKALFTSLPEVENGAVTLIGCTTTNEINSIATGKGWTIS